MAYKHITYEMARDMANHLLSGRSTRQQLCGEYGLKMPELAIVWKKYGLREVVRSTKLSSNAGRDTFNRGEAAIESGGMIFPR